MRLDLIVCVDDDQVVTDNPAQRIIEGASQSGTRACDKHGLLAEGGREFANDQRGVCGGVHLRRRVVKKHKLKILICLPNQVVEKPR
jgi:hypothetical protein